MTVENLYTFKDLRIFKVLLYFGGLFNIIFALLLAVPELSRSYFLVMERANELMHLGGAPIRYPEEGIAQLLINTSGLALVLIGSLIILSATDPIHYRSIPLFNAIGRIFFIGTIIYYVAQYNIARIMVLFGSIDIILSVSYIYYSLRLRPEDGLLADKTARSRIK